MEAGKEEAQQHVFLNRASRASRGKRYAESISVRCGVFVFESHRISFGRMTKLLDDEVEEDEVFWNQEALKEVGK